MGRDKGRGKRGGRGGGRRFAAQSAEEIEQRNARLAAFDERRARRRAEEDDDGDRNKNDDDDDADRSSEDREATLSRMLAARAPVDEEEKRPRRAKGAEGVVEVDNPNHRKASAGIKISELSAEPAPMTRRQREEAERAAKAAAYRKRHEAGLTEEYKRDMAKLEEVKKRREEARAKADAEKEVATAMEEDRRRAAAKAGLTKQDVEEDEKKKKKKSGSKKSSKNVDIEKLDKITIKKMKPAKLKEELKLRGLEIQGTGKQLTERLLQYEANR